MLAHRLTKHALGKVEMTPTQVTAALGLLRKTLPDMSAIAHSGTIGTEKPEELDDAVLAHIATAGSARVTEAESLETIPDGVH